MKIQTEQQADNTTRRSATVVINQIQIYMIQGKVKEEYTVRERERSSNISLILRYMFGTTVFGETTSSFIRLITIRT